MAFKVRVFIICDNVVQHARGTDLIGVHFVRRVRAFPEVATIYAYFEATLSGADMQGVQGATLQISWPGQVGGPQELPVEMDFGRPGTTRVLLAPIEVKATFDREGTWTFRLIRGVMPLGEIKYEVVSEEKAAKAGDELNRLAAKEKNKAP